MENKSELFDLRREKRELDAFLSTIAEATEPHPLEDIVRPQEPFSSPADSLSVSEPAERAASTLNLDLSRLELEETPAQPVPEERVSMPGDLEVPPRASDSMSLEPEEARVLASETTPADVPQEEERKPEVPSEENDVPRTEPPESYEPTRPAATVVSDERISTGAPVREDKPISGQPAPGKKKEKKTNAYDFAPEKKSTGIGKWLWIGVLIIVLIASLIGYFWFNPERGGRTADLIKSYLPVSQSDRSAVPASVQGIHLLQIRQKLVYNMTLKKNIRVLEGVAENITLRPVSRIKIVANLYNAEGTVLASAETFCGNVIIDDKLESLDANGILSALRDTKTMEDRIQPKGQIPFMIVFTGEPAGVFRLAVLPAEFKQH